MDNTTAAPSRLERENHGVNRGASLEEIEAVYLRDRRNFVRVATRIIGDPHEANDIVQDAFAQAVGKRRSFRRSGPLEAWLWRLVVNAAHSSQRHCRDKPTEFVPDETVPVSNEPDPALRGLIAALPERQRLVLFLRYYADLDYVTIAQVLGMRKGTVSSTLSSAHDAIRTALTKAER